MSELFGVENPHMQCQKCCESGDSVRVKESRRFFQVTILHEGSPITSSEWSVPRPVPRKSPVLCPRQPAGGLLSLLPANPISKTRLISWCLFFSLMIWLSTSLFCIWNRTSPCQRRLPSCSPKYWHGHGIELGFSTAFWPGWSNLLAIGLFLGRGHYFCPGFSLPCLAHWPPMLTCPTCLADCINRLPEDTSGRQVSEDPSQGGQSFKESGQ